MISTAAVIESFSQLPEKISLDEAVERLIILDRYERAMQEMGQSKGHNHADVVREMGKWIRKER